MDKEAKIHCFDGSNKEFKDDDGDTRKGWYFQFVDIGAKESFDGLYGPYPTAKECEKAAVHEWTSQTFN